MGLQAGQLAGPSLNWSPWPGPPRNGLGPGFSLLGRVAGRGLFGDPTYTYEPHEPQRSSTNKSS